MICELNLDENWMDFKKNFEIFLKMLGNDIEPNQVKGAMLLYTIRERALKIFHATLISSQDKHKNLKSHRSYDFVHSLKRNVVQERYIFNTTVQAKNEPFDSFVKHLKKLIKNCDYGDQTDNLLCDRIVLGVTDKTLQEMLLQLPNLTLEKAIDYCKFVEAIRFQQLKALNVQIDNECSGESNSINEHQSNSSELNLTKAKPTFEEENHFETPAAVDFPRIKEEVQDEDDIDHTFSSKCSLVMSTEDIQLKAEKSFDENDIVTSISTEEQFPSRENITRTIDPTTNNLLSNTHHQHNYVMLSKLLSAPCKIPAIHDQVNGEYNYDKQYVQKNSTDTPNMDVAYTKNGQELFKSEGSTNMPFSITNTSSSNYENIQQLVQENIERSVDKSSINMQFPITNKSSFDYETIQRLEQENIERFVDGSHVNTPFIITNTNSYNYETIQQLSPENIKRSVDESIVNTPFTITNKSSSNNENIQLLAQENTEGSFDEPPMNISNSHHMNLSGVNGDIKSRSGPGVTKDHKKLHRSKNPKIFTCEECHKQFSRHSGLRIHLLIHKGEKPYKCEDCGKYFRDRTSLRRHRQRIHHDAINNYVCPICNKVYFEKSVFLKHMEKESGTKRFHCKECNKSYTEMSSYRRHTRLHGGKKPFKCDLCNRRFTAICNVRQHMLTQHSRVLPFQCPECDKSFPRKYLFKKHVEEHSSKIVIVVD